MAAPAATLGRHGRSSTRLDRNIGRGMVIARQGELYLLFHRCSRN